MIEINLIPDVKLEYLKARRQRRMVISASIIVSIVAAAVVVLLAFYTFGVQSLARGLADSAIKEENEKLMQVTDLSKTLTIQNQMMVLDGQHKNKNMSSRLFDVVAAAVPRGENAVFVSRLSLDTEDRIITIEGEAENGYEALEVFKKTLAQTTFSYRDGDGQDAETKRINIAESITDGERRYGENSEGERVLRFSLSFTYPEAMLPAKSKNGTIRSPENTQNATDSARGVPESLFREDTTEDN